METYTFLATRWDVGKALEMVAAGDVLKEGTLAVSEGCKLLSLHRVDEKYADKLTDADLERPVILAVQDTTDDSGPFTMLIDGWHRIWKANQLGLESLPAVLLDGEKLIVMGLGR
jgi:hypothetical protein